MAIPADPGSLDPFTTPAYAVAYGNVLSAIYDPLVWADPATGTVQPNIAESLTADGDARVWTLTIRPNVAFSDGQPFDAAAVKANWLAHAEPATGSAGAVVAAGLKLTITAPLRLSIELPSPNANFDRAVANNLAYIASPRALADLNTLRASPVGAGPFVLAERKPGEQLTLRRNPRYWQAGRPYLDRLEFRVAPPGKSLPEAVDAGGIDLASFSDPMQAKEATDQELGVIRLSLSGGLMLAFNTRKPPFDNPATRRAVANSLSTAEINRRFFADAGTPAQGIFALASPLASPQLAAPNDDREAARAAFDTLTLGGTRPVRFSLLIVGGGQDPNSQAGYIRQQVEQFPGVHLQIEDVDTPTLIRRTIAGDFDIAVSGMWMSDPEPVLYDFLRPGSPTNVSGYSNAVVTEAMNSGRLSTDTESRRAAYTRVQLRLNEDVPFWVYQEAASTVVFAPTVTGVQPYNDGLVLFDRVGLRA
ncbi:ABC transporter substrate-binding protein [Yinghuangia soli]|uniref:ABC transporter substrate-binding protein n=1 Tax=Yinghuangia soli TaxID=2908204 RepID=A0AA41U2W6_9ACTN|nr:ABC transporter substrate-binding protein [Yinghuangia soli]MCF2531106.1 ABC transporter substrate-binding protein [Yinghuangia soli]